MHSTFKNALNKQKGAASVIYIMFSFLIIAITYFMLDGSYMLQSKKRANDAMEAASVAIISLKKEQAGPQSYEKLANLYKSAYLPNAGDSIMIEANIRTCDEVYSTDCQKTLLYDRKGMFFGEVALTVRMENSLLTYMYSDVNEEVLGYSIARKSESDPANLIIALDYSGSMGQDNGGVKRSDEADAAVTKLLDQVKAMNKETYNEVKSQIGVVTFNSCAANYDVVYRPTTDDIFNNVIYNPYRKLCINTGGVGAEIPLSDDASYSEISGLITVGGSTSTLEGLVRSVDMLVADKPYKKKNGIIIISDGIDNRYNVVGKYNSGFCDTVRERFKEVTNGELEIYFIYVNMMAAPHILNCAGADNVYNVSDYEEVFEQMNIIWQELVGHNFNN